MQWFKLYGIEMLADPKYQRLTPAERSCWITLLCLASIDGGIVRHCEEDYLMTQSGISPLSEDWNKTRGILTKLEMLGMITQSRYHILIKNWEKRQKSNLTGYERVKKYRLKQRQKQALITNDNVNDNANDNIDKIRIDKIREEEERKDVSQAKPLTQKEQNKSFFESEEIQEKTILFLVEKSIPENVARPEVKKFVSYWSELNGTGKKQRWELEKTFEVKRRLGTWFSNVRPDFRSKISNQPSWRIWN